MTKVDFTGIEWNSVPWTMLVTLYLRAYESRSEHSILRDHAAAELVERIEYDWQRVERSCNPSANQFNVVLRARQLDEWAQDFLNRHPDATVLHLGCGMDSRAFRLDVPSTARWYDVDTPEVIALRRRLIDENPRYRMVGSSVTDEEWLDEVPTDKPTLVIAEGLVMFLTEAEFRSLLQRVTDRFPAGEIAFDAMPPSLARMVKLFKSAVRTGEQVEQWNPRLRHLKDTPPWTHHAEIPPRFYRNLFRILGWVPWVRRFDRLYLFSY
ncbi:class I SAM-dependent methyltransferase [Mycolicibacterium sp. XJ870]